MSRTDRITMTAFLIVLGALVWWFLQLALPR